MKMPSFTGLRRTLLLLPLLMLLLYIPGVISAQVNSPTIDILYVDGTINPVMAEYIERGIRQAEEEDAVALIIQMNTPGGLLSSTEDIVINIMNADVPIIVYVAPKGAWAASAGVFITLSSHIAAMTPGTTIGAAHPVSAGDEELSKDELEKITSFSAKWIETIAEERGRNLEEARLAVTESKSFSDIEALELNLIDIRPEGLDDLVSRIDGWQVELPGGRLVTLDTRDTAVRDINMSGMESFLFAISDPNIAYILLSLAILGITVEIFNPGLIFPGVAGAISGLLAFYSLGVLPVNYAGILLMLLAFGLFVAEVFTPTFGLLTAGGITSLVIGSLILFKGGPLFRVDIWLIVLIAVIFAALLAFVINLIVSAHKRQAVTGREELIGKTAVVRSALDPEGTVFYEGEIWAAILDEGSAAPKEEVVINRFDNLKLYVSKKDKGGS